MRHFREAIDCSRPWPSAYYKLSRLVADPLEKRRLYEQFVDAQREMADAEQYADVPVVPQPPPMTATKH